MIAIDNNPHDAMKTERCVSILKKYHNLIPSTTFILQPASILYHYFKLEPVAYVL